MNVVIYCRYSSYSQGEQSIEGQLKVCREYAERKDHHIVREYIDRALTAKDTARPEFRRMIADSEWRGFEGVLVYQLDRIARSRLDSAVNKQKLKENGVKIISVNENIPEGAAGILFEGMLEARDEAYSFELAEKVRRGQQVSIEKRQFLGGSIPMGFKIVDKKYTVNEDMAPIVLKIFELYTSGHTVKEITDWLNGKGYKTISGAEFNKNSLRAMLQNKRYIGHYVYGNVDIPDTIPRIVSDELFYRVAERLGKNKKAPARARAKANYILTTKLYCGHCKEMMVGVSGTSKMKRIYNYYACKSELNKLCKKKRVPKDYIESLVIDEAMKLLTDENIEHLSQELGKLYKKEYDRSLLKRLEMLLKEKQRAIDNLLHALEQGEAVEVITRQLGKREGEKKEVERQISNEKAQMVVVTQEEIQFFFTSLRNGDPDDIKYRKMMVSIFVNKIYLYDDKLTIIFNSGDRPVEVDVILEAEIERNTDIVKGSHKDKSSPPDETDPNPNPKGTFPVGEGFGFVVYFNKKAGNAKRIGVPCFSSPIDIDG